MIQCRFSRVHMRALATTVLAEAQPKFPHPWKHIYQIHRNYSLGDDRRPRDPRLSRYRVFEKIERPQPGDTAAWLNLLDYGLPSHLRKSAIAASRSHAELSARDVAEILLAAQRQTVPASGIDLFFLLGFQEHRWSAVVWIVKSLVEAFPVPATELSGLSQNMSSLGDVDSISKLTTAPIHLPRVGRQVPPVRTSDKGTSLDDSTDHLKPGRYDRTLSFQHNAIGQIWRSLGTMTLACTDGEIKPEILEIIAFLHHKEIMPSTIYNAQPVSDSTQIQITPMLNLFSSRILTSLSDAAWRAHAKLVVEEAKARGGNYSPLRPEIPGTVFRVNVAGLRTEVWLELILWSSLLGGWILEGIDILKSVARQPESGAWRAYSWRSMMSDFEESGQHWDDLKHVFNTGPLGPRKHSNSTTRTSIQRTISSEVVNAYIDALPSVLRVGVGERGVPPAQVLNDMTVLRSFLRRSGLTLGAGSWDAIVWRYIDTQESVINRPDPIEQLAGLLPFIGEDLSREARRDLPAHILDGNTLVIDLFHQALRSRIQAGDLEGAFRLLKKLQAITDKNKRQSLIDFLQSQRTILHSTHLSEQGTFMSNFTGIDFPAFHAQIPLTTLSLLLELILDVKAYEFGKWLIYNEDIDGPIISKSKYKDPVLLPSLIRYATETSDQSLMAKLLLDSPLQNYDGLQKIPERLLQNFFNSQIHLKRWEAATRLLLYIRAQDNAGWNVHNLAYVARAMLLEGNVHVSQDATSKSSSARELFKLMVQGQFEQSSKRRILQDKIDALLIIIACVDRSWAEFCLQLRPVKGHYSLDVISGTTFDLLLRGIVSSNGSACGRRIVDTFWSEEMRRAQTRGQRKTAEEFGEPLIPQRRTGVLDELGRQRLTIRLPSPKVEEIVVFGGVQPNIVTIRIVLDKALTEFKRGIRGPLHHAGTDKQHKPNEQADGPALDSHASETISWAVNQLRFLHVAEEDIHELFNKRLSTTARAELNKQQQGIFKESSIPDEGSVEIVE